MSLIGPIEAPGIGDSQRTLLAALKRLGESTLAELEGSVDLAVETVRSHLRALVAQGLVERAGLLRAPGPGRPRVRYRLTGAGEALFPRRERELLRELAEFLLESGRGAILEQFFTARLRRKRGEAEVRLAGLPAAERLEAVARLLSEEGFLAEVMDDGSGPRLRLGHCPLRDLVDVSRLPCRAEMSLVGELLGSPLHRESFIPDGAISCTYAVGPATAPRTAFHVRSSTKESQPMNVTSSSRVGEIATHHPLATRVFARHGIDFCCGGGAPLSAACAKRGLDTAAVLEEIERTIAGPDAEGTPRWDEAPAADLVRHILERHHEPLREELPRLESMARKVHRVHGDKDPERLAALLETFLAMKSAIEEHLSEEEETLFPAILAGAENPSAPLGVLVDDHSAVGRELERIRELTDGFRLPEGACNTWSALWHGLAALESDLHEHIHLENNVLFPRVAAARFSADQSYVVVA